MALQAVQTIAPQDKVKSSGGRKGGDKFGAIAGAIGAGAIVASGGAAAPAVLGAAGTGAALGGLAGGAIRPERQASTAIERRMQTQGPQLVHSETSEKLKNSLMALHEAPAVAKRQYAQPLLTAYMTSVAQDNQRA